MFTKNYALLVGVSQISTGSYATINNKYLPGAKYDVDRLDHLLSKSTNLYSDIELLIYNRSSWAEFNLALTEKIADGKDTNSFLYIHFTGHSFQNSRKENILCFQDRDVHENEFILTLQTIPSNFTTFVCLNCCFSEGIYVNNTINFNGPIGFLSSTAKDSGSISSPRADSLTYFMKYFIDTWKNYNQLSPNYNDFNDLLKSKTRYGVKPCFQAYNDRNNFFGTTVPILYDKPSIPVQSFPNVDLFLASNSNGYIQVDVSDPRNSFTIIDSFTVDVNDSNNSGYISALITDIQSGGSTGIPDTILNPDPTEGWKAVEFIGVVLIKVGEGNSQLPYPINYLYNDDINPQNPTDSNGLVVLINTENNFQLVSKKRTSGRVTNKIGGL